VSPWPPFHLLSNSHFTLHNNLSSHCKTAVRPQCCCIAHSFSRYYFQHAYSPQHVCCALAKHRHTAFHNNRKTRCLVSKVHPWTGYDGSEGEQMYSSTLSLTSALVGWSTPRPSRCSTGKEQVPFPYEAWWAQGRSGPVRKISPPPGFDTRTGQPVASRYTNWVIPAHTLTSVLHDIYIYIYINHNALLVRIKQQLPILDMKSCVRFCADVERNSLNSFFLSMFLSLWVWPLLDTHSRCRGLMLQFITLSDTHTHSR